MKDVPGDSYAVPGGGNSLQLIKILEDENINTLRRIFLVKNKLLFFDDSKYI